MGKIENPWLKPRTGYRD